MVMPMSSSPGNSMFPADDFNYSSYKEECWNTFRVNPRPKWVTTEFGGHVRHLFVKLKILSMPYSESLLSPLSL